MTGEQQITVIVLRVLRVFDQRFVAGAIKTFLRPQSRSLRLLAKNIVCATHQSAFGGIASNHKLYFVTDDRNFVF